MNIDVRTAARLLIATLASPAAQAADKAPDIGTWDCNVATFVITKDSYDPGDGPLKIESVEKLYGNYLLTLPDNYQVGLSSVTDTTMEWSSMASGDMFQCKRVGK